MMDDKKIEQYFNMFGSLSQDAGADEILTIIVNNKDLIKEIADEAKKTPLYQGDVNQKKQSDWMYDVNEKFKTNKERLIVSVMHLAERICLTQNSLLQRGTVIFMMPVIDIYLTDYIKEI